MTLGDALNQIKETSLASVEELHNLAGGADIKAYCFSSTPMPHFVGNDNLCMITSSPWSYFHAKEKLKPQATVCICWSYSNMFPL